MVCTTVDLQPLIRRLSMRPPPFDNKRAHRGGTLPPGSPVPSRLCRRLLLCTLGGHVLCILIVDIFSCLKRARHDSLFSSAQHQLLLPRLRRCLLASASGVVDAYNMSHLQWHTGCALPLHLRPVLLVLGRSVMEGGGASRVYSWSNCHMRAKTETESSIRYS